MLRMINMNCITRTVRLILRREERKCIHNPPSYLHSYDSLRVPFASSSVQNTRCAPAIERGFNAQRISCKKA